MDPDLLECRSQLERKVLELESKTLQHVTRMDGKLTNIESQLSAINTSLLGMVPMPRFRPVEIFTWGLMGGVGLSVLSLVLARTIGV